MVNSYSVTAADKSNPALEWQSAGDNVVLFNPAFASIELVSIPRNRGLTSYDQPIIVQHPGAICIARDSEKNIALISVWRPTMPPDADNGDVPLHSYESLGQISKEFPRGGADNGENVEQAAIRELAEEIYGRVISLKQIGKLNPNSSYFARSVDVCLADVTPLPKLNKSDTQSDPIKEVVYVSLPKLTEMVREGQITCGITLGALALYLIHEQGPLLMLNQSQQRVHTTSI